MKELDCLIGFTLLTWNKQRCIYSDVLLFISAIGILPCNTPLEEIFAENRLAMVVPLRTVVPGIGICSAPLDLENSFYKNEIRNQILILCYLLYIEPLLAPQGASSCFKQNRFLFQSRTLNRISAGSYKTDLTLPSFRSI